MDLLFDLMPLSFDIDAFSSAIRLVVDRTAFLLLIPPVSVVVFLVTGLTWWLHRSLRITAVVFLALFSIANLGFWRETVQTLTLIMYASVLSILVGVPIGILVGHRPWLRRIILPILDIMQTLPPFIYLIPTLILFGLGTVPALLSTVVFSMPALIRITQLGISTVPVLFIEVGKAFGATKWQMLWKIEFPHALPSIMTGINQCVMLSLSMVVISAIVGAGGLGAPVIRSLNTVNVLMGFKAGATVVLLAIVLDRLTRVPSFYRK